MTEYVVDPAGAHSIIRAAESKLGDTDHAGKVRKALDAAMAAFGASRVRASINDWTTAPVLTNISTATTRVRNAAGASHEVVETLEAADLEMNAQIDREYLSIAREQVNKAASR